MASKDEGKVTITARDFELLAGALKCLKSELVVDYKKMAERFGFANANSAKATWSGIRRKLDKIDKGIVSPSLTITPFRTKDKSANKKRKTGDDSEEEEEEDPMPTSKPSKKKGRMAKYVPGNPAAFGLTPASPADSEDQDDDEELPVNGRVFGNGDEIKHEG